MLQSWLLFYVYGASTKPDANCGTFGSSVETAFQICPNPAVFVLFEENNI